MFNVQNYIGDQGASKRGEINELYYYYIYFNEIRRTGFNTGYFVVEPLCQPINGYIIIIILARSVCPKSR